MTWNGQPAEETEKEQFQDGRCRGEDRGDAGGGRARSEERRVGKECRL